MWVLFVVGEQGRPGELELKLLRSAVSSIFSIGVLLTTFNSIPAFGHDLGYRETLEDQPDLQLKIDQGTQAGLDLLREIRESNPDSEISLLVEELTKLVGPTPKIKMKEAKALLKVTAERFTKEFNARNITDARQLLLTALAIMLRTETRTSRFLDKAVDHKLLGTYSILDFMLIYLSVLAADAQSEKVTALIAGLSAVVISVTGLYKTRAVLQEMRFRKLVDFFFSEVRVDLRTFPRNERDFYTFIEEETGLPTGALTCRQILEAGT